MANRSAGVSGPVGPAPVTSAVSNTAASGTPIADTKAMSLLTDGRIVPSSIWETALAEMPSSRARARSDIPDRSRSSRSLRPRCSFVIASISVPGSGVMAVTASTPIVTRPLRGRN